MSNRTFIVSPISNILQNSVISTNMMPNGFSSYPVVEYILPLVFLKMTGCLEQKIKTICWEMATYSYVYRYELLSTKLGECSNYKDKNNVYKELIKQICETKAVECIEVKRTNMLRDIETNIQSIFDETIFAKSFPEEYNFFFQLWHDIKSLPNINVDYIIECNEDNKNNKRNLFINNDHLKSIHNQIINFRNSIAHNTKSQYKNLPSIQVMFDENYKYENYFLRFAILLFVDKLFINVFEEYAAII